ncbi:MULTISPECIES: DUF4384 domain-containing protein [Azospirillum]|uniref:DUF4384 domain-containing protein n=1 Tax=Azospirillum brasilense TaxID=192 RepID=A0ABU4P9V1_AZOBR|nr:MULTISPECIES: DUF4384 domain-containing protein [Azospirillum]ALJ35340.1 hypothetical protein AMK58_07805 [Azospirillum brasilense]MDW7555119.1 DUF4384 domain-containing protein [Azospirillum brasilense]MDW7594896.1 DUF4384 domain-containing protein [Azospirillum brasilense]MDW7629889.1 DUF4384 domain-containing protein [Azospirillum brasilense]MDX5954048.1 DUF4384 domain-containing protein [Azospirillum brasilense]
MNDAFALTFAPTTWRHRCAAALLAAVIGASVWPVHASNSSTDGETAPAQALTAPDDAPIPAVPDLSALRTALTEFHCAELEVAVGKDQRIAISGLTAGDTDPDSLALLAQDFLTGQRAAVEIERVSPALCEPLTLIGPFRASNAGSAASLSIRFKEAAGTSFVDGQDLMFDIVAPDFPAHLQVDYFTSDGDVIHLLPNPLEISGRVESGAVRRLGERGAGGRFWSVGPPYGHELIVVVASPAPLFAAPRPEAEAVASYLPALKQALDSAAPATVATARFLKTRAP